MLDRRMNIYFNEVQIPTFIKVTNIDYSTLPVMEVTKESTTFGERVFSIDFIITDNKILTDAELTEFQNWLRGDNWNPSKLTLPRFKDVFFMAKVSNSVDIGDDMRMGGGNIEFICYDSQRFSKMADELIFSTSGTIVYTANTDCSPLIQFTVTQQCSTIKLEFYNKKYRNFIELNYGFKQNDVVLVDMKKKNVKVNGVIRMPILSWNSRFHKMTEGDNNYELVAGSANVVVSFRPEFI